MISIIFEKGTTIIAKLIQWWTCSEWSHVGIVCNDSGNVVEANWPKVEVTNLKDVKTKYIIMTPKGLTETQEFNILIYALTKVGKKYDWRGLFSFLLKKNINNKSYYFCSELVAESFEKEGVPLVRRNPYWITPQDLYESMNLEFNRNE